MADNTPKGIEFFNIKSGETHFAVLEPQIQAFINSSDMGTNASRGQDFGWRLGVEWVKKVKAYRRDEMKMSFLADKNGGKKPTTTQLLYAIYGEQLRAAEERLAEDENPFEQDYQRAISDRQEGVNSESIPTDTAESVTPSSETEPVSVEDDKPTDLREEPSTSKPAGRPKSK